MDETLLSEILVHDFTLVTLNVFHSWSELNAM